MRSLALWLLSGLLSAAAFRATLPLRRTAFLHGAHRQAIQSCLAPFRRGAPTRGWTLFSGREVEEDSEEDFSGLLPDRARFLDFYRRTVKAGKEMRLDQFLRYEAVAGLLDEEKVTPDDINQLWVSAVGDAAGLNEDALLDQLGDFSPP